MKHSHWGEVKLTGHGVKWIDADIGAALQQNSETMCVNWMVCTKILLKEMEYNYILGRFCFPLSDFVCRTITGKDCRYTCKIINRVFVAKSSYQVMDSILTCSLLCRPDPLDKPTSMVSTIFQVGYVVGLSTYAVNVAEGTFSQSALCFNKGGF